MELKKEKGKKTNYGLSAFVQAYSASQVKCVYLLTSKRKLMWLNNPLPWSLLYEHQISTIKFASNSVAINLYARGGRSPVTLLKTVSHIIDLFKHHKKFEKQLLVHRKKQAITFHVKIQSIFTLRRTYLRTRQHACTLFLSSFSTNLLAFYRFSDWLHY